MESIWGKSFQYTKYSDKTLSTLDSKIDLMRNVFLNEFKVALDNRDDIYIGCRVRSNEQITWALQSNVTEVLFLQDPKHYLMRVFLGASSADYYYNFEKDWG